ncbi:hypothetical protein F5Y04DRAFT_253449 [Hypomontagnella monticulosa]|nr:hypothetical protein F5Y04DRAFT_253449 [Hypomontagnella monticulosa]
MSSTSQPHTNIPFQFVGDNLQGHNGHRNGNGNGNGQPVQPYPGNNDLSSQPLLTTSIPPFMSNVYPSLHPSAFVEPLNGAGQNSGLSAETSLVHQTSWGSSSGSQPIPQTEQASFQLPTRGVPISQPEPLPMRYVDNNLAVLSAEQYDEGRYPRRPASKANPKRNNAIVPIDNARNSKKRARNAVDGEQSEAAEEPKRTRGRPRLETKDQTPTERRRTQIRLAQRAYRNRKENAITDLQAKIDGLKEVNNEINNAYQNLFDYASQRGLLAQAPEFGQQLERLQALIKQTQEQDGPGSSEQDSPEGNSDEGPRELQRVEDVTALNGEPLAAPPENPPQQLWAGVMVSHEPVTQLDASDAIANLDPALNHPQVPQQYEIITAPTPENASFGPNMSAGLNFLDPAHSSWARHPFNRLTGPRTMSFNEWSFARRLHRHAVERAAMLVNMPNPPPARMSRVFGFVMLFETLDEIRARTSATLSRIRDEPLNYWEHPFHRLGGSGTHFGGPSSLSGNSTYQSTGFGNGPFNERTMRVRDTLLGVSQYINMSGWEGTWFDSGEVETYLAQNGIVIPTSADIHTLDVPPGAFADVETQPQIQLMQSIPPTSAAGLPVNPAFTGMSANVTPPAGDHHTFTAGHGGNANTMQHAAQDNPWAPISVTSNLYGSPQPGDENGNGSANIPSFTGFDNMATNVFPNTSSYLFPHHEPAAAAPAPAPRRVVLDVNEFIGGLISHATCLGRAPAFRPKDIVSAFWGAVIAN